MDHFDIINNLRDDDNYYGSFGNKYLSNSNIKTLLKTQKCLGFQQKKA